MTPSLVEYLKKQQTITEADAKLIVEEYEKGKKNLDDILLQESGMSELDLLKVKSEFYHLPSVNLKDKKVERPILDLFPQEVIDNYQMLPFEADSENVKVAMINPDNLKAREAVDFLARQKGWNTQFFVTVSNGFKAVLKGYENLSNEVEEALSYTEEKEDAKIKKIENEKDLEKVVKSAPISKMVNVIIRHAVEGGASDIHIEPAEQDSRVRYRIDGQLHTTLTLPKYVHASIVSRIKVLANLKIDETRKPQDGRIHMNISDRAVDFRVSTLPLAGSEKVVMRILDITKGAPALTDLGFIGRNLEVMERNVKQPNGLFLITGPTGSGKSTTLFSAISELNNEGVNIVTLEDPVEYYLPGVNQSQVNTNVGYTFASGLRSILRQDPDVIMVGEIRDNETAELAVQAALTGHMVLSTLHTNSALATIPRLLDMEVEPFLLTHTINAVGAQRLVRKICQYCKAETKAPPQTEKAVIEILNRVPENLLYDGVNKNKLAFYKGKGCAKCGGTGMQGRLAIVEIIENTVNMQRIIAKGFDIDEAKKELSAQGFLSMNQDGVMKVMLGMTTIEEVSIATKN